MKRTVIYNVRNLCLLAALSLATAAGAQENKAEKEKNLNREMTLEREYDPSVQDANKVNTLPVIKEPEVRKVPIDYAPYTVTATPDKAITVLPSGSVMTQMDYNKRRGYVNFGIGTYMNINGDLGYHILNTEKDKLNIFYSHRSSNGNVKYIQNDEKVKAKLNDNLGGINFKHNFEKMSLLLGAKYGHTGFNYYGFARNTWEGGGPNNQFVPSDVETNQVNQTIQVNAGVESKEDATVGYLLDLGYTNFSHKYALSKDLLGPTEHTMEAKFDLHSRFNSDHKIGIGGNLSYYAYGLPSSEKRAYLHFENHAEGRINPYYGVEGENWKLKLGASFSFYTGKEGKVMVSPDVAFNIEVADKTELYAIAGGKLRSNSMYELSLVNRYMDPTKEAIPSRNWLDATVGIRSNVLPGFWFDVFAGYQMTSDDWFFLPNRSYETNGFGNYSVYEHPVNTTCFRLGANLKYSYQWLDLGLKGVYSGWDGKYSGDWAPHAPSFDHAYGRPDFELNFSATVRPMKALSVALDYNLATGRYTRLFGAKDVKMNDINELSLTGTYAINKTVGVYAKLNNLLFQKYEMLYGYPVQGFSAMVGVNINF